MVLLLNWPSPHPLQPCHPSPSLSVTIIRHPVIDSSSHSSIQYSHPHIANQSLTHPQSVIWTPVTHLSNHLSSIHSSSSHPVAHHHLLFHLLARHRVTYHPVILAYITQSPAAFIQSPTPSRPVTHHPGIHHQVTHHIYLVTHSQSSNHPPQSFSHSLPSYPVTSHSHSVIHLPSSSHPPPIHSVTRHPVI